MEELRTLGKVNIAEAFAKYTGGHQLSFLRQRALEQALLRIGEEIHTQYTLSFRPPDLSGGGFHELRVEVRGRSDLAVHTRAGYWSR